MIMPRLIFFIITFFIYALGNAAHCASLYDTVQKGNRLYRDGKFDEALKTYVDGQIEHADELALKYNIASSHYKTKNYDEAVKGYLDVAAAAKDTTLQEKSLYNCGNALYQQGKLEEAIQYYKKALELDPNDQDARHNLEFVQQELKKRMNEAKETEKKQQEQKQQKQDEKQQQQNQQQDNQQQKDQQGQQQEQNKQQQEEKQEQQKAAQQQQQQEQKEQQASAGEQKPEEQKQTQGQSAAAENKPGEKEEAQAAAPQERRMTKEEAQQLLSSIEENRSKFVQKKAQEEPAGQYRPEKDW
jgi:Ca-activated chloride channel family protein